MIDWRRFFGEAMEELSQLAPYAASLLAYAWPLLQKAGEKLGEKAVDKAADKGADKVFEYGKQLWDKLRGKPEAQALEESVEQADGKPSVPALTAPLQRLLAADPQLAQEIEALLDQAWQHQSVKTLWVNNGLSINNSPGATIVGRDQYQGPVIKAEAGSTVIVEASPGAGAAPAAGVTPQLPDPVADFTGRKDQAEQLIARLRNRQGAAITAIGGQGGVGKTELAYYVAREVRELYPGGQVLVNLRGLEAEPLAPEQAMATVILAVEPEQKLPDKPEQIAGLYHGLLADRAVLVLADNAKGSEQVRSLVPKPPSALLVTSRQTVQLGGIKRVDLDELPRPESVALLRAILGDKPAEDDQLDSLAELCGDLPLALWVAGNRLAASPALPVGDYLKRVEEKRSELRFEGRDVMAVLDDSVEALERDAPKLAVRWRSLAVFPAPFDRAAAEAVGEFEDGELDTLVGRSLLLYDAKDERFRLHDLMRDLAQKGWGDEEAYNAAKRHAEHYLKVSGEAGSAYLRDAEGVLDGLRLFDRERVHIEAGQAWAAAHAPSDDHAAILAQLYPLIGFVQNILDLRLHQREIIRWLEASLEAARKLHDKGAQGLVLGNLGPAYAALGETRRAIGGAKGMRWATWAWPTPLWGRRGGRWSTTSSNWRSRARRATGGAKEMPWATWAMPTSIWGRQGRRSSITSSNWRSRARRATGAAKRLRCGTWAWRSTSWASEPRPSSTPEARWRSTSRSNTPTPPRCGASWGSGGRNEPQMNTDEHR